MGKGCWVLLPMVDVIEQSRMAVDERTDVTGRVTIEAVLQPLDRASSGPGNARAAARPT